MWPDEEYAHSKLVFTLFKQVEPSDFVISNSAWPVEEAIAAAVNKDLFFNFFFKIQENIASTTR